MLLARRARLLPAVCVTATAALAVAALPGCTADTGPLPALAYSDDGAYLPHQLARGLVVDDAAPIPDVPKPLRFVAVPSRSSASTDGRARTVTHVYQGRAGLDDLRVYYLAQLRNHGWRPLPGFSNDGDILTFAKNTETVQVSLSRAGGVSTVTVLIRPREV